MATAPVKKKGLAAITDIEAPAYTQKNQDTASNVASVIDKGGALMKRAETAGLQQANRRGLLSSSMAVNAAQDSVLDVATPIGLQNASQNAQNNLSHQGFEQNRVLQGDQTIANTAAQDKDIAFRAGESAKDRTQQTTLQQNQFGQDLSLQKNQFGQQTAEAAKDRQLQSVLQKEQLGQQLTIAEKQIKAEAQAQGVDLAARAKEAEKDRKLQQQLASWNLDDSDRSQVAEMLKTTDTVYEQAIATINQNTNMKAADREAAIKAATKRRDNRVNMIQDLYSVDIQF